MPALVRFLTYSMVVVVAIAASDTPLAGQTASSEGDVDVVLRPGDPAVDGSHIVPYEVVWVQYFAAGEGRTLRRTLVDRVERESTDRGVLLVRTQRFLGLDGVPTSERINRIDAATLSPLREQWGFPDRPTHVDYDGVHVWGALVHGEADQPAIVFDERVSEPGFDFNVVPLLLASIDLEPGLSFRLPHVIIAPPGYSVPEIAWATFRVERREPLLVPPLGRIQAWRVVEREHDMVFWISEEAPYLLRLKWPIDDATTSVMELGTVTIHDD